MVEVDQVHWLKSNMADYWWCDVSVGKHYNTCSTKHCVKISTTFYFMIFMLKAFSWEYLSDTDI